MGLLTVGLSHRSAPVAVLERVALTAEGARELARAACDSGAALEAVVLSTCNRLELWAEVESFHTGLAGLTEALCAATGASADDLAPSLRFAHGDAALERVFTVTAGLDSMALGESQVLGQVRAALRRGQEDGTVGRALDPLLQRALRVGKRVHSETGLDGVARSLLDAGLADAAAVVGDLSGARVLVVGAGSMSALAATSLHRRGVAGTTIANRTPARAARLAEAVQGGVVDLADARALRAALADADVVVSCTGAVGHVLRAADVAAARADRAGASPQAAPQLVIDLALPRDVEPAVGDLPGVELLGLAELHERLADGPEGTGAEVQAARAVVAEEVREHLAAQRAAAVVPVVAALRAQARDVVAAEVDRLRGRLAGEPPRALAEAELALHRAVEKLLHTPTVRVRALAAQGESGAAYARALQELFDLSGGEPAATAAGEPASAGPAARAGAASASARVVTATGAVTAATGAGAAPEAAVRALPSATGLVADVLHAVHGGAA